MKKVSSPQQHSLSPSKKVRVPLLTIFGHWLPWFQENQENVQENQVLGNQENQAFQENEENQEYRENQEYQKFKNIN